MPQLRVLFWNIQTFGNENVYRTRNVRNTLICQAVLSNQADILCIQEVTQNAIATYYLQSLQQMLNTLPAPFNNWYYDWIKGSLLRINPPPADTYPFATAADLDWDAAHHEGYAMFWNQNIAKFVMQAAPPIRPPTALGPSANSQSEQCRLQGAFNAGGMPVVWQPYPGWGVPGGGLQVPAVGNPYIVPAGSTIGGVPVGVATPTPAGTAIPALSVIGPGGITLNAQTGNVNPVVIPGGFTLTDALTLPAAGTVVVPQNALGLVMFGRDSSEPPAMGNRPDRFIGDISGNTVNYVHGGANYWNWIEFTRGTTNGATRTGSRRPAYVTIKVNRPGFGAADQLVPIIVYHAPSAAPASSGGMQRSAYSQPMYQAYDWTAGGGVGAWIDCNNALLGGDFNVPIDDVFYAYDAFTDAWGPNGGFGGGAGATMAIATPPPPLEDNPPNKSIVSLTLADFVTPRAGNAIDDFRQQAIDNIFYRGLNAGVVAVNAGLSDLITQTTAGGWLAGAPVQQGQFTPAMVAVAAAAGGGPPLPGPLPNMNAPFVSRTQILAGQFGVPPADGPGLNTAARRAAEFVNLFVSDHLPAAIQFTM